MNFSNFKKAHNMNNIKDIGKKSAGFCKIPAAILIADFLPPEQRHITTKDVPEHLEKFYTKHGKFIISIHIQ